VLQETGEYFTRVAKLFEKLEGNLPISFSNKLIDRLDKAED